LFACPVERVSEMGISEAQPAAVQDTLS